MRMPKYFWGAGEQLYYFQGFWEHEQNNFREQRKIFPGSLGDFGIIFREQGSTEPPWDASIVILSILKNV